MAKKRARKSRPLLLVAAGMAALSYYGCDEPTAIGNPKRPPDMGLDMSVTPPPDLAPPRDLESKD